MSAPTLLWLHIHQYEQFEDVRVRFSPRENLLLGVNGAGKTRLLKLIRAVMSLDFRDLLSRPFDVEFELLSAARGAAFNGVTVQMKGRVMNASGQGTTENIELQPPLELAATLSYQSAEMTTLCEVRGNEYICHQGEPPKEVARGFLTRPGSLVLDRRPFLKAYPHLRANYLGESDYEFRALTQSISFTAENRRLSVAKVGEGAEHLGSSVLADLLPLIVYVVLESQEDFKGGVDLTSKEVDEPAFARVSAALGASTVRLIPKIAREQGDQFECRGIEVNVEFLDGTRLSESELTFGQRRYLYAGIVFAFHPGAPVLVDELDNGLHPRLVATLLDLWKDRQVFLVSHNKLVIDHTNFAGPEDVQDKIHIIRRGADGRQTIVALDEAEAHEVYEKISVAIQSPSDVLRAEGLW